MRAFISIELPKEAKDELWKLTEELKELASVKWVAKKNYHVCLKFLGEVSEEQIEKIKAQLKKIRFEHFEVSLGKTGVFPNESRINVVWVDLEPANKIINLQSEIEDSLSGLFERDTRFAVHVTLGRVRAIKDKEKFIRKLKSLKINKIKFKIENFYLVKSELTKEGPIYRVLERF